VNHFIPFPNGVSPFPPSVGGGIRPPFYPLTSSVFPMSFPLSFGVKARARFPTPFTLVIFLPLTSRYLFLITEVFAESTSCSFHLSLSLCRPSSFDVKKILLLVLFSNRRPLPTKYPPRMSTSHPSNGTLSSLLFLFLFQDFPFFFPLALRIARSCCGQWTVSPWDGEFPLLSQFPPFFSLVVLFLLQRGPSPAA